MFLEMLGPVECTRLSLIRVGIYLFLLVSIVQSFQPSICRIWSVRTNSNTGQPFRTKSASRYAFPKVIKSEEEWKSELSPQAYNILFEDGTEPAFTSDLNDVKELGTFTCVACGSPLFRTNTKFESGSGWPSFYAPIDESALDLSLDFKLIVPRTECRCASCDGHLGHVFDDGPDPTGQRFCMNGAAMSFRSDELEKEGESEFLKDVIERETASGTPKPPLLSVIPNAVLFGGAAYGYLNTFLSRLQIAQESGASFPSSVFDAVPLVVGLVCTYLATRGLFRLL